MYTHRVRILEVAKKRPTLWTWTWTTMMHQQLYGVLEFDKVLSDIASRAHCSCVAEKIRHLKPTSEKEQVQKSLSIITEMRGLMDRGGVFPMRSFEDVRNRLHAASVEGSVLEVEALRNIHDVLVLIETLARFFEENDDTLPLLKKESRLLKPNPSLVDEIARVIDLQSLQVHDQASSMLRRIRRDKAKAQDQVRKELERLLGSLAEKGILQERLITVRSGRFVLPVKETHRYMVKGVLHDKSASGATSFIEPLETLELNNRIRRLEAEERHEVEKVLRLLTAQVRKGLPDLDVSFSCLVTLDTYYAMALTSKALNQHAPAISDRDVLTIKNGRHPLLILRKEPTSVVPLTLSVGDGFKTLVITGPNAGGKTVALKTVGLLSLMTACGLHIPADPDSELPVFNRFFVSVGDAQSIEMDLSTFSAHLGELRDIVAEGRKGDLVLIDEIGTGTDPQEGSALSMAILEVLTERAILTVVTTHHGALKAFAHRSPGVANGSMAFDSDTLTPTYAFRAHIPGSSYALEIARRLGIADTIVKSAKECMGKEATRLEALILELERQREKSEALQQTLESEKAEVETLRARWEYRNRNIQRESRDVRRNAIREADAIIKGANAAVEKAVRTIREGNATKEAIQTAKSLIQEKKESLASEVRRDEQDDSAMAGGKREEALYPGVQVRWEQGKKTGTVLEKKDEGRLLVAFGDVKIVVSEKELHPLFDKKSGQPSGRFQINAPMPTGIRSEIDLRGMHVEEALTVADKFLSDAVLAGLDEIKMVHGIGTGILKKNIIAFLESHPLVMGMVHEKTGSANPGVTMVKLNVP